MINQNPEQIARDNIDKQLNACGWIIQDKKRLNLAQGIGVSVREYSKEITKAQYALFVNTDSILNFY
jgi:type I restriction enzyme R subunit